MDTFMQMHAGF